jgi:hypothetical protein
MWRSANKLGWVINGFGFDEFAFKGRLASAPISGFTCSPVCLLCGLYRSRNTGKGCFSIVTDVSNLFLRYKVS